MFCGVIHCRDIKNRRKVLGVCPAVVHEQALLAAGDLSYDVF